MTFTNYTRTQVHSKLKTQVNVWESHVFPSPPDPSALDTFLACDPWVILGHPDGQKHPLWRQWQLRRPGERTIRHHVSQGYPIGFRPGWNHSTVVDVDKGNPAGLMRECPPVDSWPSRARGLHLLFWDHAPRRDRLKRKVYGCTVDIKSNGIVWLDRPEALETLASALTQPREGRHLFPAETFGLSFWDVMAVDSVRDTQDTRNAQDAPPVLKAGPTLEHVQPGGRNAALFDAVHFHAYSAWSAWNTADLAGWHRHILDVAIAGNRRFPEPLDGSEAMTTAYSISTWVSERFGPEHLTLPPYLKRRQPYDHSPAAQSRRGIVSASVRRTTTLDRDKAICADYAAGQTQQAIADAYGLSQGQVGRIVKRPVEYAIQPDMFDSRSSFTRVPTNQRVSATPQELEQTRPGQG